MVAWASATHGWYSHPAAWWFGCEHDIVTGGFDIIVIGMDESLDVLCLRVYSGETRAGMLIGSVLARPFRWWMEGHSSFPCHFIQILACCAFAYCDLDIGTHCHARAVRR